MVAFRNRFSWSVRLPVIYAVLASTWIVSSDLWLALRMPDADWAQFRAGMLKGLGFVAATALLLYWLARRMEAAVRTREVQLAEANRALGESEGRYRALFSDSSAILLVIDPDTGCIEDANEAAVVFYGWPREELIGRDMRSINTGTAAEVAAGMARAKRGTQEFFSFRHRLADGRELDVEVTSGPVRLQEKVCLLSVVRDVTKRLRVERELRDTLALNQAIWESAALGLIVYESAGRAVQVNAAAAQIIGATVEQLRDHDFRASPTWQRHGLLAACEQALAENRVITVEEHMVTIYGKSLWLGATFTPFVYDGRPHVLMALQDLSRDADALARFKLLEAALEASPDAFVITDPQGKVEWVNAAFTAVTGYTRAEIQGRNPSLLKSGRQDDAFYQRLWETITTGRQWSGELQNVRKGGGVYWEHMTIAPVMSATGGIHHYVAVKKDITAQKDLETQMARTQRLESIGLLAGGIAHDLNNVLAPILMAADLFKLKYPAPEDQQRFDLIRSSADRGAKIVRQVLSFARGVDGERTIMQARHLLKELRHLLDETFPRAIEIKTKLPAEGPALKGDLTQLHQMLMNLAVNARDAMPDGGVLSFAVEEEFVPQERVTLSGLVLQPGPYAVITVADTGHGIPADKLERVFDPFFTTKAVGEGTGLGLSTVLGIVRGHQGGIEVSSRPGEGTTFRVYLPAERTAEPAARPAGPAVVFDGAGRVVLLVDDELPVCEVTLLVLESRGFEVVVAVNGEDALRRFETDPDRFDLVLLDLIMPKLGGGKVAAVIKARRPDLPIILTSGVVSDGKSTGEDAALYRRYGDFVLSKPFAQNELITAVEQALATPKKKD
jgi:two-component system, cell cycle sensor histidine kinase and response regulator CckA